MIWIANRRNDEKMLTIPSFSLVEGTVHFDEDGYRAWLEQYGACRVEYGLGWWTALGLHFTMAAQGKTAKEAVTMFYTMLRTQLCLLIDAAMNHKEGDKMMNRDVLEQVFNNTADENAAVKSVRIYMPYNATCLNTPASTILSSRDKDCQPIQVAYGPIQQPVQVHYIVQDHGNQSMIASLADDAKTLMDQYGRSVGRININTGYWQLRPLNARGEPAYLMPGCAIYWQYFVGEDDDQD